MPQDLLATEIQRLTRVLLEAETEIRAAETTTADVKEALVLALDAACHCEQAYLCAPDKIRRQINQGFEKLYIGDDGAVVRAELTEPFAALLTSRTAIRTGRSPTPENGDRGVSGDPGTTETVGGAFCVDDRVELFFDGTVVIAGGM